MQYFNNRNTSRNSVSVNHEQNQYCSFKHWLLGSIIKPGLGRNKLYKNQHQLQLFKLLYINILNSSDVFTVTVFNGRYVGLYFVKNKQKTNQSYGIITMIISLQ